jgi:chromosome segregation protein
MRLSKIKLAGFKSFVDPTVIQLPSNLTGVVGPNGCGKSNVIDAVRWVMGESSAKTLRGESMEDVIFNGSSARKPVGMATIELVFDNHDGAIAGSYANYAEVSVRRTLARDGTSSYYLNGARCRRKDVTHLFLGTGLGPRSYSIIEQGMVSRLIEARPEDMRSYLEEAAGISRYKERRRETELRISHTRENLERLGDLREEVGRQLEHLEKQSQLAEKYKELKQRERRLAAELIALKLRTVDSEIEREEHVLAERRNVVEAAIAEQRRVEAEIERGRALQVDCNEALSRVQERYYKHGAEVARLEQSIQHARDMRQQCQRELQQLEDGSRALEQHLEHDRLQLEEQRRALASIAPALGDAREVHAASAAAQSEAERALGEWQVRWNALTAQLGQAHQSAGVENTRTEHLEAQLAGIIQRLERLGGERASLTGEQVEPALAAVDAEAELEGRLLEQLQAGLQHLTERVTAARARAHELDASLHQARSTLQTLRGRRASLEALQQAALGRSGSGVTQWLARHGLEQRPRLAQELTVASGWERAVETVLGAYLEAVCVNGIDATIVELLGDLDQGSLTLLDAHAAAAVVDERAPRALPRLSDHLRDSAFVAGLLPGVYAAESLRDALAHRQELAAGESIVTRDGLWIGRGWLRISRDEDPHAGVLAREQELRSLRDSEDAQLRELEALERRYDQARRTAEDAEQERAGGQEELNRAHARHAQARARRDALSERSGYLTRQLELLGAEESDLAEDMQSVRHALAVASERLVAAQARARELEAARTAEEQQRERLRVGHDERRAEAERDRDAALELTLQLERHRSAEAALVSGIARLGNQRDHQQSRTLELHAQIHAAEEPLAGQQRALEDALAQRLQVEASLREAREQVDAADTGLREIEQERSRCEQRVEAARMDFDAVHIVVEQHKTRRLGYEEQFAATGFPLADLQRELPDDAAAEQWETKLRQVEGRIERLGPINLAAIDEYQVQLERKKYLDAQHADLSEALETLEQAIRKIDRETRTRFQETFDKVDAGLKRIFPRLFGGGHAYLELTGDDLLSAGVGVMARPPGKRNSTIHLLSGGEKALTAVALIFSIFELNPAPFCMLDEVDAPLDDANVERFCEIVREMSDRVQFVVITHNKRTIELATHLAGVTMQEAGVSRLVSVDVEEAVRLAAT